MEGVFLIGGDTSCSSQPEAEIICLGGGQQRTWCFVHFSTKFHVSSCQFLDVAVSRKFCLIYLFPHPHIYICSLHYVAQSYPIQNLTDMHTKNSRIMCSDSLFIWQKIWIYTRPSRWNLGLNNWNEGNADGCTCRIAHPVGANARKLANISPTVRCKTVKRTASVPTDPMNKDNLSSRNISW